MTRISLRLAVALTAVIALVVGSEGVATATPAGQLDTAWGGRGVASTTLNGYYDLCDYGHYGSFPCSPVDHVAAMDARGGRVLVASPYRADHSSPQQVAVVAFDSAGQLDSTFGVGGRATFDAADLLQTPAGPKDTIGLAPGPSGTEYLSWTGADATHVSRLDASGALDPSFGQGGTILLGHPAAGPYVEWKFPLSSPDGSLTLAFSVALARGGNAGLLRLDARGAPDPSFGQGGVARLPLPTDEQGLPPDLALRPDGGVFVLMSSGYNSLGWTKVMAFDSHGADDPGFGTDGVLKVPGILAYTELAVDAADRVVLLTTMGQVSGTGGWRSPVLTRLLPDGTVDPTFGAGGTLLLPFPPNVLVTGSNLQIDARDQPVFAADVFPFDPHVPHDLAGIVRLTAAGRPDPSFGTGAYPGLAVWAPLVPFTSLSVTPVGDIFGATTSGQVLTGCAGACSLVVAAVKS